MRKTFIEELSKLAELDPTITLLVGDVGFSYIEDFQTKFPKQFINCGVTEQSMVGIAAGMALSGLKPYVYSMIPFVLMRPYEQVRNDVCYNNANVKLIGVRGSVHYKFLGFSHNIIDNEDADLLRNLPNIVQYYPKSEEETALMVRSMYSSDNPAYIRL